MLRFFFCSVYIWGSPQNKSVLQVLIVIKFKKNYLFDNKATGDESTV